MARRVLCIESDEGLRERLRELLEREGYAVDLTASGLEGIARALTLPPDLVLADIHLPDIEGPELAARLKRERALAAVPFVAVGDSPEEHDVALAAGADGFVARGHEETLAEELRAFLAGKRERLSEEGERTQLKALSGAMAEHLESAVAGAQRATRRVEELGKLRSAFVHNLAHELSTPLTPLAGYLRILSSGKLGALSRSSSGWSRPWSRPSPGSPASSTTSPTSRASRAARRRCSAARSSPIGSPTRWSRS